MSTRQSRVEQLLRREIAGMLLRGDVKDPRIGNTAAISITGAKVSADLSVARIFVDLMGEEGNFPRVLKGLNAGAGVLRGQLSRVVRMRRMPSLRFERDPSIEHGAAIERVLAELRDEAKSSEPE